MNDAEVVFTAHLVRCYLGHPVTCVVDDAATLCRLAKRHYALSVALCNGTVEQAEYDRRQAAIGQRINRVLERYPGTSAEFGGDPRGYTVKLHLPSHVYNTWGGEESGWGIG